MTEHKPIRLQKFLARAGIASRRGSENLMTAGRVTVNGVVATVFGMKVFPAVDEIRIDDRLVESIVKPVYLMLNKPAGYLTTMDDPQGRPTVRDLIPTEAIPGLFPVGRLDFDTTGLLLCMTDGDLAHSLLHPRNAVPKRYKVLADGIVDENTADLLRKGVELNDGLTLPALIEIGSVTEKPLSAKEKLRLSKGTGFSTWQTEVYCTITEGRKRQVKRMFAFVGHPVLALSRLAFGPLQLGDLPEGSWRYLTDEEIQLLSRHTAVRS
ncbi:MAG: rRNA pseudouridine synthase [Coriobacteriales bacterium]|jgi:23S rRNA pseudouridine2605 synthase|nr:rRNA pseudouridine synthase [Coriobacteriales bacterium]